MQLGLCHGRLVGCHGGVLSSLAASGALCWGLVQLELFRLIGQLEGFKLGLAGVELFVPLADGWLIRFGLGCPVV